MVLSRSMSSTGTGQLFHGPVDPFGDLAVAADLNLPPRRECAGDEDQSSDGLKQSGSSFIL